MNIKAQRDISRKLKAFEHAKKIGNVAKTCRYFGISREAFYRWKRAYVKFGEQGLISNRPCSENPSRRKDSAIDDATRIRALKVYEKHNQNSSIGFINYVVDKFPFRIKQIRTDNGMNFNRSLTGISKSLAWNMFILDLPHRV